MDMITFRGKTVEVIKLDLFTCLLSSFWCFKTSEVHSLSSFWSSTKIPGLFASDKFWKHIRYFIFQQSHLDQVKISKEPLRSSIITCLSLTAMPKLSPTITNFTNQDIKELFDTALYTKLTKCMAEKLIKVVGYMKCVIKIKCWF